MTELRDRTALLTGGSGGLGRHLARALADAGAGVVLSGRDGERLEREVAALRAGGARAAAVTADLADPAAASALVARAEEALGPLDVLVNNAGVEAVEAFSLSTEAGLAEIVAVNLTAPLLLTRAALPGMAARGWGRVVNIASLSGRIPAAYAAAYSATKAGLIAFTHSLRGEYAGQALGFSAICPGFVAGEGMYARLLEAGLPAPAAVGAVAPEKVAAALLKALRDDAPELLVSARPVRPLIAAGLLAPRIGERLLAGSGVNEYFGRIAAHQERGAEQAAGARPTEPAAS
jgi:short-subunit dehydrogenase